MELLKNVKIETRSYSDMYIDIKLEQSTEL